MSRARALTEALASLRITPFALLALVIAVLAAYHDGSGSGGWLVAGPLAVLALNLAAALAVDPRLRLRAPLLVFHVALLAALLLATAGELLRFSGRVEVLDGATFDPTAVMADARGPLYRERWLEEVDFSQRGFEVDFQPGLAPGQTRAVIVPGDGGGPVQVGNTQPFIDEAYRFHTSSNKGFAALLAWHGAAGGEQLGAVNFPSWPLQDWKQIATWTPPGGSPLELELLVPTRVPGLAHYTLDSRRAVRGVRLRVNDAGGGVLATLAPGEALDFPAGRLRFVDTRMWMGYRVSFDPLLHWLLATGLVGAAALGLHFWQRFGAAGAGREQTGRARPETGAETGSARASA